MTKNDRIKLLETDVRNLIVENGYFLERIEALETKKCPAPYNPYAPYLWPNGVTPHWYIMHTGSNAS